MLAWMMRSTRIVGSGGDWFAFGISGLTPKSTETAGLRILKTDNSTNNFNRLPFVNGAGLVPVHKALIFEQRLSCVEQCFGRGGFGFALDLVAAEGVALVEGQKAQMKSAGGSEAGSTGLHRRAEVR